MVSDSEPESKLLLLLSQLTDLEEDTSSDSEFKSVIRGIYSLINSMDLDSQPKPESELISLIKQTISLVRSIPDTEPESELKSLLTELTSLLSSIDSDHEPGPELMLLYTQAFNYLPSLAPGSELITCLGRLIVLVEAPEEKLEPLISMDSELEPESKLISLVSQLLFVQWGQDLLSLSNQVISLLSSLDLDSQPKPESRLMSLITQTLFFNSMDLDSDEPLSSSYHSLSQTSNLFGMETFHSLMSILDLEPEPELMSLIHQISPSPCLWIQSGRSLFPYALKFNLLSIYVSFVTLWSIKAVSACHRHTGYLAIPIESLLLLLLTKEIGLVVFVAERSTMTTEVILASRMVLFVRGSFKMCHTKQCVGCHEHHLKLDENEDRDYDENKQCQACIAIYFGNYYSCIQCEFILHETCANLSRRMHHPIHPHLLTLVTGYDRFIRVKSGDTIYETSCSACPWLCTSGFFYECGEEGCNLRYMCSVPQFLSH
ncbi:unnamed protein product [Microthlaspi erraticum]|uniref:DC1 domain-containing protein n=1 Tax=Microthlaspi erraticum TaxID=1685480 RepID=A0A6D2K4S4_9BRAS|nr:unnamed protein product [Microthlaspi erraticum]